MSVTEWRRSVSRPTEEVACAHGVELRITDPGVGHWYASATDLRLPFGGRYTRPVVSVTARAIDRDDAIALALRLASIVRAQTDALADALAGGAS